MLSNRSEINNAGEEPDHVKGACRYPLAVKFCLWDNRDSVTDFSLQWPRIP